MPFYEYRCSECNHELEVLQKMTDGPLKLCPECGKESLRKLMSLSAFRLKGQGWYETDFKNQTRTDSTEEKTSKSESADGQTTAKPDDASSKKVTPEKAKESSSKEKASTQSKNTETSKSA